ncbi:MAG: amidase [Rhodospirillales bacterium]|nr:amidase [Rhodospirillales bacterium]
MTDTDPAWLSATELVDLYRRKALSPVEATAAVLRRIETLDRMLNAFCLVDADGAMTAAQAAEERWRRGAPLGRLDGVPVSIKDLLVTRGWPTLRGSRLVRRDQPWKEDAPAVARLRETGAVLLGKTTTPEFGWKALGDSPLTGTTRNPWNPERTPGGSSAGAAAAVAAGMGPLALGTDGAGSIRIPCAFTGIFGIKATFGRVAAYPPSPMGMLANVGPMTRTVADSDLLLSVIGTPDDRDPYCLPPTSPADGLTAEAGVKGLRIGFSPRLGYARVDPEVAEATARAAQTFAELGARVEMADPGFESPRDALLILWQSGAARMLSAFPAEERKRLDPGLAEEFAAGCQYSAKDYVAADAIRTAVAQAMNRYFRRFDLLLTPSVAVTALPVGQNLSDPAHETHWVDWTPFSYPFNMSRHPACSIPCGVSTGGLPLGAQLVGRHYEDRLVLRAAYAFEAARPFARVPDGR